MSKLDRQFNLIQFQDYLALEAGNRAATVENYLRDLRRMAAFASLHGVTDPAGVDLKLLRKFVF
jgi:site-specific recombinase XerC